MAVSPIQRVSAILILIAVIIWFFNTTLLRTLPEEPLVLSGETIILSRDMESDRIFLRNVLQMSEPHIIQSHTSIIYSFEEGLLLKEGMPQNDTLTLRVSRMHEIWDEILASHAHILSPPEKRENQLQAFFKLPGGYIIRMKEL
jgi:hypothetical protein